MGALSGLEKLIAGTMLFGAVSLFSGCNIPKSTLYVRKAYKVHNKELTEANKFLLNFPGYLPGARRVNKYLTRDAFKTIVLIRQDHYKKNLSTKNLRAAEKNQDNIYLTLSYLIDHKGLKYVYDEWYTKYDVDDNNMPIQIKNMIRDMKIYDKNTELYKLTKQEFDLRMAYGATERLVVEGKLKIKYPETLARYHLGTMEEREDIALGHLSKDEGTWLVLLFGATHDILGEDSCGRNPPIRTRESVKDNVAEWNKKHPDKMFSVIEVESKGIPPYWKDK